MQQLKNKLKIGWMILKKLFLDDIRNPNSIYPDTKNKDWDIVRNYNEFVDYIIKNGMPDFISFDHDLGIGNNVSDYEEKTGYDCVKYLVENEIPVKDYRIHSMNPVGKENLKCLLNNWKLVCKKCNIKK